MLFTRKSVSQHGTAYYTRDGFKPTIAIPAAHFAGDAPETITVEGAEFAEKAVRVQATGIAKALKTVDPAVRKAVREAGRQAEREALAAAGVSL